RRRPAREGDRRPRRRPRDQSDAARGADRGRGAHGPRPGALGGVRRTRRRPGHGDAQVAAHHPADGNASGGGRPRRGAAARGAVRREGRRRGGARADRGRGSGRAPCIRRTATHGAADEGLACGAARRPPPRQQEGGGARMTILTGGIVVESLDPVRVSTAPLHVASGRIAPEGAAARTHDCSGCLVVPGNVCAHTHLYSALARGMPYRLDPPEDFLQILQRVWWRLDRALDLDGVGASARVGGLEALLSGTTTLIDHHASPCAVDGSLDVLEGALSGLGVRHVLCYETSDRDGAAVARAGLQENRRFIVRAAREALPLSRGLVGAHASFTLSDDTLRALVEEALDLECGLHVHAAEDGVDAGAVERLAACGALDARTLLAHGVHLDEHELRLVAEAGSWLAHNARSNMNNAVGRAEAAALDVRVPLGT